MKRNITVIVESAENNLSAYVQEVDGITATGKDFREIKKSAIEAIDLYKESCEEFGYEIPEVLRGEYEVTFKYDLCSFLQAYSSVLNKSGLESLTGINQKQLWHYASGQSKPRKETVSRVSTAIQTLASELSSVQYV